MSIDQFLRHHGFHGPRENELSSKVWREDPAPVLGLVERYRAMDEGAAPTLAAAQRMQARFAAESQLNAALSPVARIGVRRLLQLTRHFVPTREVGRDAFLKGMDVVRFCARVIGADLVSHGLINDPEDAFYLTPFELTELPEDLRSRISLRRDRRAHYEQLELPDRWRGLVEPRAAVMRDADVQVRGLGVSAGVIEGLVRVVLDPSDGELEAGEILVCRTTDPGWASYFFLAAGVVIDIGGPLSHGAIVARELGLPCVINTRDASQQLRTGDTVRIDGTTGAVELLNRPRSHDVGRTAR
jgi:pyruvate,water dikinase